MGRWGGGDFLGGCEISNIPSSDANETKGLTMSDKTVPPFHVDVPIFRMSVVVCANCTPQEACAEFYAYKGKQSMLEPRESDGWVQHYAGDVFMWVRDLERASTVFHELVHVAYSICEIKGMHPDEELIAYLVGWLKIGIADRLFEPEV